MTFSKPVFTTREIAAMLSVTPSTVDKWRQEGRLQAVKLSGSKTVRITPDSLEKFLNQ